MRVQPVVHVDIVTAVGEAAEFVVEIAVVVVVVA
jgi:hypothetical protein